MCMQFFCQPGCTKKTGQTLKPIPLKKEHDSSFDCGYEILHLSFALDVPANEILK